MIGIVLAAALTLTPIPSVERMENATGKLPEVAALEAKIAKLEARVEALEHPKKTDSVVGVNPIDWPNSPGWLCALSPGTNLQPCQPMPNDRNEGTP